MRDIVSLKIWSVEWIIGILVGKEEINRFSTHQRLVLAVYIRNILIQNKRKESQIY